MAILATGAVSVVAAIVKVIISFEITRGGLNTNVDPNQKHPQDTNPPYKVTISTILYWSMIEAGIAIIAACLPTLQCLLRKTTSFNGIISSVRNAFSLHSIHSQPPDSKPMGPYTNIHGGSDDASSVRPMVNSANGSANPTAGIEKAGCHIFVTKQLTQHDDLV
ncbi:MAG: hypothetical protein Q9223_000259 [Gallowayella weberi]